MANLSFFGPKIVKICLNKAYLKVITFFLPDSKKDQIEIKDCFLYSIGVKLFRSSKNAKIDMFSIDYRFSEHPFMEIVKIISNCYELDDFEF